MIPISATLITYNEADRIEAALESLAWASEIVVVDSGSGDGTPDLCRRYTDRVFHRDWTGFVDQKNHAVERAAHDWIFSLDADERVSEELQQEISGLRAHGFDHVGYSVPRVARFMGRWIRHGDWYPDRQLRLFDRRHGAWQGGRVHESVKVAADVASLQGEILHFTYRDLSDYLARLDTYSTLAAADYRDRGRSASISALIGNPFLTFFKGYLLKRGFQDGIPGLLVAGMAAISVFFKYAKLYESRRNR